MLNDIVDESPLIHSVTRNDFRLLSSNWATGVAVVTTTDMAGNPYGLTLSATTSLSLDPMQFLVCVDNQSTTLPAIIQRMSFGINMLSQSQMDLSRLFAGKGDNKFEDIDYTLVGSVPKLDGVIAFARCKVAHILQGGDHKIIIGDLTDIVVDGGDPLIYFRGNYRQISLSN